MEASGSARQILEQEQGLLAGELIEVATRALSRWVRSGVRVVTVLDHDYPDNLRGVHDRPALIFVLGSLEPADARSVAVIGARDASPAGIAAAEGVAANLIAAQYTVISGLARGIDTAAHRAAIAHGGRTLAVIGNGVARCYPPESSQLQALIATHGAVVSQFWPDTPPSRRNFPRRNAVMSGLALATVIVEAGPTSGARTQARLALAHGRPVLMMRSLLAQDWAHELAQRPGVHLISSAEEAGALVEHLSSTDIVAA